MRHSGDYQPFSRNTLQDEKTGELSHMSVDRSLLLSSGIPRPNGKLLLLYGQ